MKMESDFALLRTTFSFLSALLVAAPMILSAAADLSTGAPPPATFTKLPIKEVTVFKDGHAFVAHEGMMPTDANGNVVMDYLPAPVIGTFWPYATEKGVRLTGVVAGHRRVRVDRTALNLRELLEANPGAEVLITESGTNRYDATILGLPARGTEELTAILPPNSEERLPEKGSLILLKTVDGVKAIAVDRIQEVIFKHEPRPAFGGEEFRNLLTLRLDWNGSKPAPSAQVGLFYLQKGIRWIPSYKIEIGPDGNAAVKLQATLINELADLDDVSVNLVIGVPSFAFKSTLDPIALQQNLAQLSQYFQTDNGNPYSPLASQFSNAIMSQQMVRASDFRAAPTAEAGSPGPELGDSGKNEDLYIFNVPHVRLRKGERMSVFVGEYTLPYRDVFTLELPFGPPAEMRGNFNSEQQREMARLLATPKVMHKIRVTNTSRVPLTTAPALLIREGRVLSQSMMTYAAPGAKVDLLITTAVDFPVKKSDLEAKRTPNAIEENGNHYTRIDLAGKITIGSHAAKSAELEVTRSVLGAVDSASQDGKFDKLSAFEDGDSLALGDYPPWWGWYGWPSWWNYFNGIGRVTWTVKLEPGQSVDLKYTWHYFWR